jgi:hypothetical protein
VHYGVAGGRAGVYWLNLLGVFDDRCGLRANASGSSPGAECERMALVALDVARRVKIVIVARCDVLAGQQAGHIEADDLCSVVIGGSGFDAFEETWNETKVDGASKSHEAIECPDGDTTVDETVMFSFVDFDVAVNCQ